MSARRRHQQKIIRLQAKQYATKSSKMYPPRHRLAITQEIHRGKMHHLLSDAHHRALKDYLHDLEIATGSFFSLYVRRRNFLHYHATVHVGGLGSRGPIEVKMVGPYAKYTGIYPSVLNFDQQVLQPLRSDTIQPTIHTGVLEEAIFRPNNPIQLTIRSQGYEWSASDYLGSIQFQQPHLNGIVIGTIDSIPKIYLDRLRVIASAFGNEYVYYWVSGLGNCNDLLPFNPINPSPDWNPATKMAIFLETLQHRAVCLDP